VELSYSCRGLQSNNPRAVAKYQRIVTKYLDSSTMELEMDQFQQLQASQGYLHQDQIDRIIQLETDFSNCKAAAEEKVKHITHIPWSPTLRDCLHKISYWKSWISQIKNAIDESDYRSRICPLYPTLLVPPSTTECKANLKIAYKENKTATNNADDLRLKHLQDLATMYSNSGNETSCQALKRIIRSEAISNTFRHLKNIMSPSTEFGLNHLLMNGPNEPPLPIYEQDELEQALLDRNNIHFRQADKTPFSTNYLKLLLGPYGTNEASQMLLDGTLQIDFTQVSRATASILRKLQRVAAPDSIDASISMEELKAAYKCWRESTSTSPSGLHLGHEKASLMKPKHKIPSTSPTPFDDRIFQLKSDFINLAISNTIIFDRWKKVVNAMIAKIPGLPYITKLRVIHIIESDLNMTMGILWGRRLMQQGETLSQFGPEQSGARKNKQCQDVLVFKHLTYSILRLSKSHGATFDNDAKSCYDRIVMLLASLASQRLGMPPRACELFLETLNQTKYHAKTSHGISSLHYATNPESTIHGPGQGGRASPAIWTMLSCLILSFMPEVSAGSSLTNPTTSISVHQTSSGFVDDITHWNIDILKSLTQPQTPQEIIAETTNTAQWWESLLHSTGGKLELTKCFYYIIYWTFDNEGTPSLMDTSNLPQQVSITDSESGHEIKIKNTPCHESHKTLGAMENPSGRYNDEVKRLTLKANLLAKKFLARH
jgi:hypothetical protein